MEKHLLKIIHYGDIQLELRTSGEGSQRFDEFSTVLKNTENYIKRENPDIIIIAGDIYQFFLAEGEEQEMFASHLHKILPHTSRIIMIPGNHDIKQKHNGLIKSGDKVNTSDSISSVVTSINSEKISYYKNSGIYPDKIYDINWAVWSQIDKFSAQIPKPNYNPWLAEDTIVEKSCTIELYHDPINGAKDFNGQPSEHFKGYSVGLSDFKANTIIANDIHNPDIIWFGENKEKLFTYSSSLVQRNFGEGNYYSNEKLNVDGNSKHGLNRIIFNLETDLAEECKFIAISNPVSRHTVYLSNDFGYSDVEIKSIASSIQGTESNKIRLVCQSNMRVFVESEQKFIDALSENLNASSISFGYSKNIINEDNLSEEQFESFEEILDKEQILKTSKDYIERLVDKTSMISSEDKEESKKYILDIFEKEFAKKDFTKDITNIDFLDAEITNFMNFGHTKIQFKNNTITKISGTNGVGKTKIFSFINWILNDRINADQDVRNKKYNYSLYFNDSSELDEVNGKIRFFMNSTKLVEINKTLTRTWKKDAKDISEINWFENLKSVPKVELAISITEGGEVTVLNNEESIEFLNTNFNFKETDKLLFVDAYILKNLIKTPSEELSNEILSSMGINITDDLLETYDQLKSEKLDNLTKHTLKKDDVIAQIESKRIELSEFENDKKTLLIDIKNSEDKIKTVENKIAKLTEDKHKVETEIVLDSLIDDQKSKHTSNTELIIKKDSELENLNAELLEFKNIDSELAEKRSKLQEHNSVILKLTNGIHASETSKSYERSKMVEEVNTLKDQNSTERLKIQSKISEKEKEISNKNLEIRKLTDKFILDLTVIKKAYYLETIDISKTSSETKDEKTKVEYDKQKFEFSIETLKTENSRNEEKIIELKESKICIVCGSELDADKLKKITDTIEFLNTKIKDNNEKLSKIEVYVIDFENQIITIQKNLDELENSLKLINSKISTIDSIVSIEENEYLDAKEYLEKETSLETEIADLSTELNEIKVNNTDEIWNNKLKALVSENLTILDLNKSVKTHDAEIEKLKEKLENSEFEKLQIDSKISDYERKLDQKKKVSEEIQKIIESKTSINFEIAENLKAISKLENQKPLAKENVEADEKIKKLNDFNQDVLKVEYEALKEKSIKNENISDNQEKEIKALETIISEIRQYNIADSSLKLYKQLLGKKGLPLYLFSTLLGLINKTLNDSLENVNFRLRFDEDTLELRFVDLDKNISRPVQFISGMQETIVGLALTKLLLILNRSKRFNILFIDEISGKVTNGNKLTYESKDYQKILQHFVEDLSNTRKIYIVDHVLEYHNERILEVQPSDTGSIIVEL